MGVMCMKRMLIKQVRLGAFITVLVIFVGGCVVHETTEKILTPEQEAARIQRSARLHTELAAEYFNRKQYKIALEEVDEALKSVPDYALAFNMLGLIHMVLGEDSKARSNFERALKAQPGNSEVHNNYGWFLCERFPEQMDNAIDHFMTALRDPLYETRHVAYANAGLCELKRDHFADASLYFGESLSLQPDYRPVLVGLIEMDFKANKIAIAQEKLSEFMQKYQPTARSLWLGMQIEQTAGNAQAADSYFFQLKKRFPDSDEARAVKKGGN